MGREGRKGGWRWEWEGRKGGWRWEGEGGD